MRDDIANRIRAVIDVRELAIELDGNRALITVVSPDFIGLSRVRAHQLVYGCIEGLIADGRLHAVTIRPSTPEG
jgi:acid stress-induced BolA-like protein IbaG/YrbA